MSELHPSTYAIFSQYMWHVGSGACTAASQQEGPGFDSRMGRCWSWGVGSPQASSAQVGYLCGVCMFSPYSQGVSSTKNPNRKTFRRTDHFPDHFTWSLGA